MGKKGVSLFLPKGEEKNPSLEFFNVVPTVLFQVSFSFANVETLEETFKNLPRLQKGRRRAQVKKGLNRKPAPHPLPTSLLLLPPPPEAMHNSFHPTEGKKKAEKGKHRPEMTMESIFFLQLIGSPV